MLFNCDKKEEILNWQGIFWNFLWWMGKLKLVLSISPKPLCPIVEKIVGELIDAIKIDAIKLMEPIAKIPEMRFPFREALPTT